jgi:hypothetical protein
MTPIPNTMAVPLIEGVVHPVLADTRKAELDLPSIQPLPYREAVARAIAHTEKGVVSTCWSGALGSGTRWTSGGWRRWNRRTCIVCAPR